MTSSKKRAMFDKTLPFAISCKNRYVEVETLPVSAFTSINHRLKDKIAQNERERAASKEAAGDYNVY